MRPQLLLPILFLLGCGSGGDPNPDPAAMPEPSSQHHYGASVCGPHPCEGADFCESVCDCATPENQWVCTSMIGLSQPACPGAPEPGALCFPPPGASGACTYGCAAGGTTGTRCTCVRGDNHWRCVDDAPLDPASCVECPPEQPQPYSHCSFGRIGGCTYPSTEGEVECLCPSVHGSNLDTTWRCEQTGK